MCVAAAFLPRPLPTPSLQVPLELLQQREPPAPPCCCCCCCGGADQRQSRTQLSGASLILEDARQYVCLLLGRSPGPVPVGAWPPEPHSRGLSVQAVADAAHKQAVREGLQRRLAAAAVAHRRSH